MLTGLAQTLEQSPLAAWVNSSALILGTLSGIHLLGWAMVAGAALVSGLHMVGLAFADRPSREVTRTVGRGLVFGLLISVVTGALLVSPRAQAAFDNWIFVVKMAVLAAAVLAQLSVRRFATQADYGSIVPLRAWGVVTTVLWVAVGVSGAAFILLE